MQRLKCGVQLYTLRKYTKQVDNIPEVFRRVKALGAETVQVSAMCPIDAEILNSIARDNALNICCTHSPFNRIKDDLYKLAEEHLIYGCKIIGLGSVPSVYKENNYQRFNEFLDVMNHSAETLKQYGMKLAYHNHNFEFKKLNDKRIYDILIENTEDVNFILDTYWLRVAGVSIIDYIKKLSNRLPVLHLKDYKKKFFLPLMCELGRGELNFIDILKAAENSNSEYAVIEQDISINPYKSLEISMDYLKKNYMK